MVPSQQPGRLQLLVLLPSWQFLLSLCLLEQLPVPVPVVLQQFPVPVHAVLQLFPVPVLQKFPATEMEQFTVPAPAELQLSPVPVLQ